MEFLSQYGLFLLKTLTLIVGILILAASLAAIKRKEKHKLTVTSLNDEYEELRHHMLHEIKQQKKKPKVSKQERRESKNKPSLFVLDFAGDIKASQTEVLGETITAVLAVAKEEDEVLLRLESPGGSVNGYGLAAAQLQRIRDKKIPLTVAIDKVAASGGYLMAAVAHRIIAAPFAIIGSIGVVAQLPNFHRWLQQHNIDVELLTAGEYKRTLTIFGENTDKGREKFQQDLEQIHHAFRNAVLKNREQLDIDKVATGEHWLALDAFALRLVDSLKTSDDYLLEKMEKFNAYKVSIQCKAPWINRLLKPVAKLMHPFA